jgi:hypothetical protein
MPLELGPDGLSRSTAEQRRINEVLATAFKGDLGKQAMDYLRSISIERVCGPAASDAELRHLEGMRFIVGVISQRIAQHHKDSANARSPADPASLPAFPGPGHATGRSPRNRPGGPV